MTFRREPENNKLIVMPSSKFNSELEKKMATVIAKRNLQVVPNIFLRMYLQPAVVGGCTVEELNCLVATCNRLGYGLSFYLNSSEVLDSKYQDWIDLHSDYIRYMTYIRLTAEWQQLLERVKQGVNGNKSATSADPRLYSKKVDSLRVPNEVITDCLYLSVAPEPEVALPSQCILIIDQSISLMVEHHLGKAKSYGLVDEIVFVRPTFDMVDLATSTLRTTSDEDVSAQLKSLARNPIFIGALEEMTDGNVPQETILDYIANVSKLHAKDVVHSYYAEKAATTVDDKRVASVASSSTAYLSQNIDDDEEVVDASTSIGKTKIPSLNAAIEAMSGSCENVSLSNSNSPHTSQPEALSQNSADGQNSADEPGSGLSVPDSNDSEGDPMMTDHNAQGLRTSPARYN